MFVEVLCIFMEVFGEFVKFLSICKKQLTCVNTESCNIRTSDR